MEKFTKASICRAQLLWRITLKQENTKIRKISSSNCKFWVVWSIPTSFCTWVFALQLTSTNLLRNIYKMEVFLINFIKRRNNSQRTKSFKLLTISSKVWSTCITWKISYTETWKVPMSSWMKIGKSNCVILDLAAIRKSPKKRSKEGSGPINGWHLKSWKSKKWISFPMSTALESFFGSFWLAKYLTKDILNIKLSDK